MLVGLLTAEQAELLMGQDYDGMGSVFYPIQDNNDNWVISQTEIELNTRPEFNWLNDLTLIEFEPKVIPFPSFM